MTNENHLSPTPFLVCHRPLFLLFFRGSKGLEFDTIVLAGIDKIQFIAKESVDQVRLLYVGMTRAKSQLLITSSVDTVFTRRLVELVAP